jgi:hypothetical protein
LALIGPSTVAGLIVSGLQAIATSPGKFNPVTLRQIHAAGNRVLNECLLAAPCALQSSSATQPTSIFSYPNLEKIAQIK